MVVAQDPETARFPEMPESVALSSADIVAPLERIGAILTDLVSGQELGAPAADEYARLLRDLRERAGIDFSHYKEATIRRRLARRLVATDSVDLEAYNKHLEKNPSEYERLAKAFLVNVTEFFRDPEMYQALREQLLPQLIREAWEARGGELRIWSAGCSTGEEAYSLAMAVLDLVEEKERTIAVRIFATDIGSDAIAFARRGIYPATALARLSPATIERHFTPMEEASISRNECERSPSSASTTWPSAPLSLAST